MRNRADLVDAEPGPAAAASHDRRAGPEVDVPVSAVRAVAAESTGLDYCDEAPAGPDHLGDRERELLIASLGELSPEDRRHVAALVESLRNRSSPMPTGR